MPLIDSSKVRTITDSDEVDHRRRKVLRNGTRQSYEHTVNTRSVRENKNRTRHDVKVRKKE